MSKTHDVQKLKAAIKTAEDAHKAERKELREKQRELSAFDADEGPGKDWKGRWGLCDKIGVLIRSTTWTKDDLTKLYQARAALRGRLHMSRRVIHHSNGTKSVETWTLEEQAKAIEHILDDHKLLSQQDVKPAA